MNINSICNKLYINPASPGYRNSFVSQFSSSYNISTLSRAGKGRRRHETGGDATRRAETPGDGKDSKGGQWCQFRLKALNWSKPDQIADLDETLKGDG